MSNWQPTQQELHTLSAEYVILTRKGLPIERLDVSEQLAMEMFVDNEHKSSQIPSIARTNGNIVVIMMKTDRNFNNKFV